MFNVVEISLWPSWFFTVIGSTPASIRLVVQVKTKQYAEKGVRLDPTRAVNTFADQKFGLDGYDLSQLSTNAVSEQVEKQSSYEFSDNFGNQLNDWLAGGGKAHGSFNGEYFDLGTTPGIFIKHGARELKVIMTPDCLVKITGGKHSISLDEIAKLPLELNDPVLLFKGSFPNSFVALTELMDKQGNDVVAIVHINRHQKRLEVNRIASSYSKSDAYGNNHIIAYVNRQIANGNLVDASSKKAPMWFTNRGLQLPKLVQTIIDANTIKAQNSFGVNSNSMQNGGKIRNHLLIFTVLSLAMRGSVYGFIRSTTLCDGRQFSALINIANSENGGVFYDLTKIKMAPTISERYIALVAQLPSHLRNHSDTRVSQNSFGVNSYDPQSKIAQVLITPDAPVVVFIPFCWV